jgi:hypothetical protein|tara:strand:- start:125 stop:316 length:192 start_codon:yes stop_codon:yes gene_type:complete
MKEPYVIVKGNSINEKLEMNIMYKAEDAVVVFKDKHNKVYSIDVPRLIKVFNNNIWENKKSVK